MVSAQVQQQNPMQPVYVNDTLFEKSCKRGFFRIKIGSLCVEEKPIQDRQQDGFKAAVSGNSIGTT